MGRLVATAHFGGCILLSAGQLTACGDERASAAGIDECRPVEGELARNQAALLGEVTFADARDSKGKLRCDVGDRAVFRQALLLGRTIASSRAMRQCVETAMRQEVVLANGVASIGPYAPVPGEPYWDSPIEAQVQNAAQLLLTPNGVHLTCRPPGAGGVTYGRDMHGYRHRGTETVSVQNIALPDLLDFKELARTGSFGSDGEAADIVFRERVRSLATTAGTLWHEVMHTHGYVHRDKLTQSVPYIIGDCLEDVAERSLERCDMRACSSPRALALIDDYPLRSDTGCACTLDPAPASTSTDATGEPQLAYGRSLAAGDFNGDGFDDLAVGAPERNEGMGAVDIYYGSVWGLYPAERLGDCRGAPELEGAEFGFALAADDFDLDGASDLAVGAPGANDGTGLVYLFSGSTDDGLVFRRIMTAEGVSSQVELRSAFPLPAAGDGREARARGLATQVRRQTERATASPETVMTTGDFDADGRLDFAVGAPGSADAMPSPDAVFTVRASERGDFVRWRVLKAEE